ncbi:MAG: hypothetical protein HUJ80_01610 [Firmicutes bacterium]|nr:hypothetical protein [Bacillota bacterium]
MKTSFFSRLLLAALGLSVAFGNLATVLTEKEEFDPVENRELATFPAMLLLTEDPQEYFAQIDSYVSDHFAGRKELVQAYTDLQLALGNKNVRDLGILTGEVQASSGEAAYFIGADYLFGNQYDVVPRHPNWLFENMKRSLELYPSVDAYYVILPEKIIALAEGTGGQIDPSVSASNRDAFLEYSSEKGIKAIDLCEPLLTGYSVQERAAMYFKTDFHWNAKGAYACCSLLAQQLAQEGIIDASQIPGGADFFWQDLSDSKSYKGDLAMRLSEELTVAESIPRCIPADTSGMAYYLDLSDAAVPRETVIGSGIEDEILDYNKLYCYNLPYYRVENENALCAKEVLIYKDSYENACTDYLSVLFQTVHVIDPRFEETYSFTEMMDGRNIDLVLFLFHEDNLSTELRNYLHQD